MSFLELNNITKRFGATLALDGVSLAVEKGEVHALVGENGSGKSTLMKILAGAQPQDSGNMVLDGKPFNPRNPLDARQQGIAMIYQELALCPDLNVAENILLGLEDAKNGIVDRKESERRAREALATLGYPEVDVTTPVRNLPIAVRQVVEIARAVALGSKVVILDEPTSSLTQADVEKLFKVIESLRTAGHAVVYISHFLEEIKRICDRLTVLRDGVYIGSANVAEVTADDIVSMMVGRDIAELYPHSTRQPGEVVLELANLETIKGRSTLQLRRGEVVGVAGLNGSGRSELLRSIFGLDPVKSGEIKVGIVEGYRPPAKRWEEGIGMLSEDRKLEGLALGMPIADNILLTKLPRIISTPKHLAEGEIWIEKMRVKCQGPQQPVGELSGGNQQKVAIGRLLHHGVDVLLLDEPTRGIDVGSKQQIYQLIDQLAMEGKAILMVSSYLPELQGMCDRIAVMHKGDLGEARRTKEITAEDIMREAAGI
ncbi:MAG: sugar ABC transporter [Armatimonadetes bacterium 55-13]|nr:sugar ABC transporter ATP-binding protein [Armatimonadota bacterium]OJU64409.1 MAG: sugar ABC transporter [Armatimonadetes bacterium 55-13]